MQNYLITLTQIWQFDDVRNFVHESITSNYLYIAYSHCYKKDAIVKIGSKKIIDAEIKALQIFQGDACVKLLSWDQNFSENYAAMMLEYLQPGTNLKNIFVAGDEEKSIQMLVDVIQKLQKNVHNRDMKNYEYFPTIAQRVQFLDTFDSTHQELLVLLPYVQKLADQLIATQGPQTLLHGDLHHENILLQDDAWVMIDPQGVVGELAYEVGAYIRNPIFTLLEHENIDALLWYRFEKISSLLGLEQQRVIDWSVVQAFIAACYADEDNDQPAKNYFLAVTQLLIKITNSDYKLPITVTTVTKLVQEQFPQWADFKVCVVAVSGWDNKTFHLGDAMSIRMPSSKEYAHQVAKEQRWLPFLAQHISIQIPHPLAVGKASQDYPWSWSIYHWIDGHSANTLESSQLDYVTIAQQLAQFLHELHKIDTQGGPVTDRGGSPVFYNDEVLATIIKLEGVIDTVAATDVWNKAIASRWQKPPVWAHGDLSSGNILIRNRSLYAVIDFGSITIGDPACDLVMAWTFFHGESRILFKKLMKVDQETWYRAAGWALWKAMITLVAMKDTTTPQALQQIKIIHDIVDDFS